MKIPSRYAVTAVLVILLLVIAYSMVNYDHQADRAVYEQPEKEKVQQEETKMSDNEEISEKKVDKVDKDKEREKDGSGTGEKSIYGSWVIDRSVDELTGEEYVSGIIESENITKAWLDTTRPAFIIRCLDGDIDVILNSRHQFEVDSGHSDEVKISYIRDDFQPVNEYWNRGPEGKTAFAPDPLTLARELTKTKVFRVEFTPFNAEKVSAVFDLTGYRNVVEVVAGACDREI